MVRPEIENMLKNFNNFLSDINQTRTIYIGICGNSVITADIETISKEKTHAKLEIIFLGAIIHKIFYTSTVTYLIHLIGCLNRVCICLPNSHHVSKVYKYTTRINRKISFFFFFFLLNMQF